MNGWGSTCGIPISAAMVVQQAVPDNQTPSLLDQIFANYGSAEHPQADVGNAAWFYDGVRVSAHIPEPLEAVKVGSMQCHNSIEQFIKLGDKYALETGKTRLARQHWCGRLTADQCYITLKVINDYYHSTGFEVTPLSAVPATCHTSACHKNEKGRQIGKEDCLVCHK